MESDAVVSMEFSGTFPLNSIEIDVLIPHGMPWKLFPRKSIRFFITVIFLIIKNTFQVEFWPICCLNDSETQEIGL